jgi:hypothetical protein
MSEEKKPKRRKILIILLIVGGILLFRSGKLDGVLEKLGFPDNQTEVEPTPEPDANPEEEISET